MLLHIHLIATSHTHTSPSFGTQPLLNHEQQQQQQQQQQQHTTHCLRSRALRHPEGVVFELVNKSTEWYDSGSVGKEVEGGLKETGSKGEQHEGGFIPFAGKGRSLKELPPSRSNSTGGDETAASSTPSSGLRRNWLYGPQEPREDVDKEGGERGNNSSMFYLPTPIQQQQKLHHPPMPTSTLLSVLPSTAVTHRGDVVDVRRRVADLVGGGSLTTPPFTTHSAPTIITGNTREPHNSGEMSARTTTATHSNASTSTATIKVRLDGSGGSPPLIFHLNADCDTVGYLLSCVAGHRSTGGAFELRSAISQRSFSAEGGDVGLSLRDAGLSPSAALFVRPLARP